MNSNHIIYSVTLVVVRGIVVKDRKVIDIKIDFCITYTSPDHSLSQIFINNKVLKKLY